GQGLRLHEGGVALPRSDVAPPEPIPPAGRRVTCGQTVGRAAAPETARPRAAGATLICVPNSAVFIPSAGEVGYRGSRGGYGNTARRGPRAWEPPGAPSRSGLPAEPSRSAARGC